MATEQFTGNVSQMRVSPWLASEDLEGFGEVEVTIEAVYRHTDAVMQGGRREKELFAVQFAGKAKQLVLNATNRKALAAAYGGAITNWAGKTCLLYVLDGVRKPGGKSGETCKGLRIKVVMDPAAAQAAEAALAAELSSGGAAPESDGGE